MQGYRPRGGFVRVLPIGRLVGLLLSFCAFTAPVHAADPQLVINELMYHPFQPWPPTQPYPSTNRTEYVEILNTGTTTVFLANYRFDAGITFTFTNGTLAPGAYGVLCEYQPAFTSAYRTVSNVLGEYKGTLNNGGERVTLSRLDSNGTWVTEDTLAYIDDHDSDGTGLSLELVNPKFARLDDQYYGDWAASTTMSGTPGVVNSRYLATPPPVVGNVQPSPALPPAGSAVKITARVTGRDGNAMGSVLLEYRKDASPQGVYTNTPMVDHGQDGDAVANDGVYTAFLPPAGSGLVMQNNQMIEFRVKATDLIGGTQTFPATNRADVASGSLSYLCKFGEDAFAGEAYPGEYGSFHMLMPAVSKAAFEVRDVCSEVPIDTTVITPDGTVIYNCGLRLRGSSSRNATIGNYRIGLPTGTKYKGMSEFNLNHDRALSQWLAMNLTSRSGAVASDVSLVRVFFNEVLKNPGHGIYCLLEGIDNDYINNHLPGQTGGNIYSGTGTDPCRGNWVGDLTYYPSLSTYLSYYESKIDNPYTAWNDLQALTFDLTQTNSYMTVLTNRVDIPKWGRSFAVNICLDNMEPGYFCVPGVGDELRLYCNPVTGKAEFFPWDYSDTLGLGLSGGSIADIWGFTHPVINKFLYSRPILPFYTGQLLDIATNTMSDANMNALFDEAGSKMTSVYRTTAFTHTQLRRANILTNLSQSLTVTGLAAGAPVLLVPSTNTGASLTASGIIQNVTPARWVLLGSLAFPQTASAAVKVTRQTGLPNVYTLADAVMFSNAVAGSVVWEDSGPGFSATGTWLTSSNGGYAGGSYHYASTLPSTAAWSGTLPQPGTYSVYAWGFVPPSGTFESTRYDITAGQPCVVLNLAGTAPQSWTDRVLINGTEATWNLRNNAWSMSSPLVLTGDVANVVVQAVYPEGSVIKSVHVKAVGQRSPTMVGGTNAIDTTWGPGTGVIVVSNDLVVAAGATLTLQPGSVLLLAAGRKVSVQGTLRLAGSAENPVYVLPQGGATPWTIETSGASGLITMSNANLTLGRVIARAGASLHIADSALSSSTDTNGIIQASGAASVIIARSVISDFVRTRFDASPTLIEDSLFKGMSSVGIDFSGVASAATVRRTTLRDPVGTDGICFQGSTAGLVSNVLVQGMSGTGIVIRASTVTIADSIIDACGTAVNQAGASSGTLRNTTLVNGPVGLNGAPSLTNAIIWAVATAVTNGPASATASDIQLPGVTTYVGSGNLNREPWFRDPAERDYRLKDISPCIGSGVNGANMGAPYPSGANPESPGSLSIPTVSSNSVNLAWQDRSADETGFEIERAVGAGWSNLASVAAGVTTFTDTGLSQNTAYAYRVRSVHARGASVYTDAASATTTYQPMTDLLVNYLRITEVMYNLPGADDGEYLEFKNISTNVALSLSGLTMDTGRYTFTSGTTLGPQQFFVLARTASAFALAHPGVPVGGVFAPGTALANGGEELWVKDASGVDILRFTYANGWYPTTDAGGYALVPVDANPAVGDPNSELYWRASSAAGGSPGADDPESPFTGVVINEVLAHTDPPLEDAIEIRNLGTNTVNISGWYLSDTLTNLTRYQIPATPALPPGGFKVFYEGTSFNQNTNDPSAFEITELGTEDVTLSAAIGGNLTGYRSTVGFNGAVERSVSFGRYTRSDGDVDFVAMSARSFGMDTPATLAQFRTGTGAANPGPNVGPIVINEIMYNPGPGGKEYVELLNITSSNIPLYDVALPTNGWRFNGALEYAFTNQTTMAPGERVLVVSVEPSEFRQLFSIDASVRVFGPFTGALNNAGDTVKLYKPSPPEPNGLVPYILVDRVQYGTRAPWPAMADNGGASLEKANAASYGNDPINWVAASLGGTPGSANNTSGAPSVGFSEVRSTALETNHVLQLGVSLFPAVSSTVTVSTVLLGGTATAGSDYSFAPGSLTFWPYETNKTIALTILNDSTPAGEPNETVVIGLTNASANASLGGNRTHTHTIVDNDATTLPPPIIIPSITTDFTNSITVTMQPPPSSPGAVMTYRLDGEVPGRTDTFYEGPFVLTRSARVIARTFLGDYNSGAWTTVLFRAQAIPAGFVAPTLPTNTIEVAVRAASDDGTEQLSRPIVEPFRTDVVLDSASDKIALFRFYGTGIPRAALVTNAYLQFTSSAANSGTCPVTLYGENVDHSLTITATSANLSGRTRTPASVPWSIPSWGISDRQSAQRTPNLSTLVSQIVHRSGWLATNGMSIIVVYGSATDTRSLRAFDGSPSLAAVLHVEWADPSALQYRFTVLTNGFGSVLGGNIGVPPGSNATATAQADFGNDFVGWSGQVGAAETNNLTISVIMDQDRQVTANFAPTSPQPPRVVTFDPDGTGGMTLIWETTPGRLYTVHRTDDLSLGWPGETLATGLVGNASGTNTYTDQAVTNRAAFYLIDLENP